MNVLICGLGSIGMRHARNLKSLGVANLVGVDPTEERRARFLSEIGGQVQADLTGELAEASELAIIATPNRFHIDQALACAENNCHLFLEKPLGVGDKGVHELIALIEGSSLFAHVGSNWKFHPAFTRMKELLDQRSIGKVSGAQVLAGQWLPDWHPWEDYRQGYSARSDLGGGIVLDMHELDYMSWLFGNISDLKGFTAHSGSLEIDTEDVATTCLRFESGLLATLQVDYIQRSYQRRYHISGDKGTIAWDIRSNQLSFYKADEPEPTIEDVSEDINAMYVRQMQHVLDGVAGNVTPVTSVKHAAGVLNLQMRLKNER